jgi:hypothetical protein
VGDDHQGAGYGGEAAEGLFESGLAAVFREGQSNGAGLDGGELGGCGGSGHGLLGRLLGRLLGNLLRWQAGGESACKNQAGKGRTCCCSE